MNKQQMIEEMAKSLCSFAYDGCHQDDWENFEGEAQEVYDNIILPHIEAQQREIERLREALSPSGSNKYIHIGEYKFEIEDGFDDDGEEKVRKVTVPWHIVKDIMASIKSQALAGEEVK